MGQESSNMMPESIRPKTLSDRSIGAVARLITSGRAKRILVLTGAGISTAAGIPDFRSPKTGLYHNLARLNLPHPEAVFDIDYFVENPRPFYVLAKELYPGKFHPTITHTFVALLAKKKLLHMLFTQNIDCLERAAGVPSDLIVEAHGSFATQSCIECGGAYPDAKMRECVESATPAICVQEGCGGLVKPDITFFGEALPKAFFDNAEKIDDADLVIVMGTSLSVYPFAGLPRQAKDGVPRLLLNMKVVGDFGLRADDVVQLGGCDEGIRKLANRLGWRDELEEMWTELVGEEEAERQRSQKVSEAVNEELDELANNVEQRLKLSEGHDDRSSDPIANTKLQEEKEGERPTTLSDAHATESADPLSLATGKDVPTGGPEGSITAEKTDEKISSTEKAVSNAALKVDNGEHNTDAGSDHTPVHASDDAATVKDGTEIDTDDKEATPAM